MSRFTLPLVWRKPYPNMWIATTKLAHVAIHKQNEGFLIVMNWREPDIYGNFATKTINHPHNCDTLAEAKKRLQAEFDDQFLAVARKARYKKVKKSTLKRKYYTTLVY